MLSYQQAAQCNLPETHSTNSQLMHHYGGHGRGRGYKIFNIKGSAEQMSGPSDGTVTPLNEQSCSCCHGHVSSVLDASTVMLPQPSNKHGMTGQMSLKSGNDTKLQSILCSKATILVARALTTKAYMPAKQPPVKP